MAKVLRLRRAGPGTPDRGGAGDGAPEPRRPEPAAARRPVPENWEVLPGGNQEPRDPGMPEPGPEPGTGSGPGAAAVLAAAVSGVLAGAGNRAGQAVARGAARPGTVLHTIAHYQPVSVAAHHQKARERGWVPEGKDPDGRLGRLGEFQLHSAGKMLKLAGNGLSALGDSVPGQWIAAVIVIYYMVAIAFLVF
jgi:hypothetical protein